MLISIVITEKISEISYLKQETSMFPLENLLADIIYRGIIKNSGVWEIKSSDFITKPENLNQLVMSPTLRNAEVTLKSY